MALRRPLIHLPFGEEKLSTVHDVIDPLMLTDEKIKRVTNTLLSEMLNGLSRDESRRKLTSLLMENTYVISLLNGKEEGNFLSLDLGGTNFRVLLCRMGGGKCDSVSRNYNIPHHKLYGPASEVFDHLARSIYLFLQEEDMLDNELSLGFTFSFPMRQKALKSGFLVTWTKDFKCIDGMGEDAVKLLEDAIAKHGKMHVNVVAILNDTTGTLMAGSYLDKDCGIGLILGTGCNAAYVENVKNVDKLENHVESKSEKVVIDIEWGAYGDNGSLDFVKTEFDEEIDRCSNHVGSYTFEKLCGGFFIGDLARLVMVKLTKSGHMFGGMSSDKLLQWKTFTARHLTDIEKDTDADQTFTWQAIKDLDLQAVATKEDVAIIRYLCSALSIRVAQIISACISVLLNHMNWPQNVVAIDGSLYRYHPKLHDMMTAWLKELAPQIQSRLILAEDGSGRGAAMVAAVAVRLQS